MSQDFGGDILPEALQKKAVHRDNVVFMKESEICQDSSSIPAEWRQEFEAAARRPLATRFRYAFIHTYKPVLDDARYRAFTTMREYRDWCDRNLPSWLGYGSV